ncbi:hypothetical protein BD769DRAFT_1367629, partial [Suillus cothurnatus]
VLNKSVLSEVQADITHTTLPSWIGRAPPDIGNPSHGKLSADQWRTLCTVHLPITLTRLWGRPDSPPRKKEILENFLDLVTAVLYGTPRRLTDKRIRTYNHYIFKYIRGLIRIYDDYKLTPNQHFSLHLSEILKKFGPPHAYWAFPFERYIGLIRHIHTNQRPSEMEATFMTTYCMGSNLHGLLSSDKVPSVLAALLPFIKSAIDSDTRGSLMSDLAVFGAQVEPAVVFIEKQQKLLSTDAYAALLTRVTSDPDLHYGISFAAHNSGLLRRKQRILSPFAQMLPSITSRGIRFTPFSRHAGDSQVLYRSSHLQGRLAMGRIVEIFVHRRIIGAHAHRDQAFALVKQFGSLAPEDKKHDVFHRFKHLRISIVRTATSDLPEAVPMQDIVAHFAACPFKDDNISTPCMAVVPLDRVSDVPFRESAVLEQSTAVIVVVILSAESHNFLPEAFSEF